MGNHYAATASIKPVGNQLDSAEASSQVTQAIRVASDRTGVDFTYMMRKAAQESNFDASATASSSSATGLYQFTSQTWLHMVKDYGDQYGLSSYADKIHEDASGRLSVSDPAARKEILALRKNPQLSAVMSGELDQENAAYLQKKVGGKIGATELYLAHFLGAYGASNLIKQARSNPEASAADLLPSAAAANSSVFYSKEGEARSVKQVYQTFAKKFDSTAGATQVASASPVSGTRHASAVTEAGSTLSTAGAQTMTVASLSSNLSNLAMSGDSTLIAAMVFGQMGGIGNENSTSTYSQSADNERKKSAISVLSAVV